MISEIIDDQYAVLVFGDIFNSGSQTAAQIVGDAWIASGATRVRNLDGCCSAVIINRATREVLLIGDLMGRRRLSYYTHGRTLLVSPHDATLMATGDVPVEFDWISIASVVGMEWALGGKNLLKHIHTCHPMEYSRWHQGRIEKSFDPAFNVSERISSDNPEAVSSHLTLMIEVVQEQARIFISNRSEIRCDLSSGFASRVVWILWLSVIDNPSRILSISLGEAHCLGCGGCEPIIQSLSKFFSSVC